MNRLALERLFEHDLRANAFAFVSPGKTGIHPTIDVRARLLPDHAFTEIEQQEAHMAKTDLDSMSIEELATLRDRVIEKLAEKVVAKQAELAAEMERLSQYGKPGKKEKATPPAKSRKDKRADDADEQASVAEQGENDERVSRAA
jgi:hypothetical protein